MRKIKFIYNSALAVAFFAGVTSCTNLEEDLNDRTTTPLDIQNDVKTRANHNPAAPADGLAAAFAELNNGSATNGGFFAVQEGGTDEAVITQKGGDWYDGGLYIRMHQHDFSPQTWAINDAWTHAYNGIFQINTLLATDVKNDVAKVAQLKTLRAYFYWRLMDVFGNIPIVTVAGEGADQSPRAEVYDFIEAELLAAIPDLPTERQDYARLNQSGAYALLARLYLNSEVYTSGAKKEFQKAIDAADNVINTGIYSLQENYADQFAPDNSRPEKSLEHIFIVPFDESTSTGAVWPMMTLHYPSQLVHKLASQPWNGFSTLEEFYNSYDDNDTRKAANFIVGPQYDPSGQQVLDLAFDKADPDGAGVNYTPFVNELAPNASRQGGARFGKFSIKFGAYNDQDNDMPLLRYAEVLLNKAEAIMRLNDDWNDADAVALVNEIRVKRGATPFPSMTEGDMLAERGRELFVEAHRRTDLIRFNAYHLAWWEKSVDPKADVHILMAIPVDQMLASSSTDHPLEQNPGYSN